MIQTQGNGINLYERYLAASRKEQGGKTGKLITLALPLLLLALLLLGFSGKLLLDNRARGEALAALDGELASLSAAREDAQTLAARRNEAADTCQSLAASRLLFELYPAPTKELFTKVIDCAGGIFNISQYAFDETTAILTIDASAASVNEVPQFVQRLRDTGLFSLVQYTGYTSRDTTEYFCTVDCTLENENARAIEALLADAAAQDGAPAGEADASDADESAMDMLG